MSLKGVSISKLSARGARVVAGTRSFAAAADVPQGHDAADLTGDKCNIGMKRRVDISLRQDLSLAAARTWDQGVESGFAASALADLFKVRTLPNSSRWARVPPSESDGGASHAEAVFDRRR
jgi:hypothetical protein